MTKVILSMLEIKLEVDSQESGSHTFSAKKMDISSKVWKLGQILAQLRNVSSKFAMGRLKPDIFYPTFFFGN